MDFYLWVGFIGSGILISFIGSFIWYKMLNKEKTLPELFEEIRDDEEDELNPPSMKLN